MMAIGHINCAFSSVCAMCAQISAYLKLINELQRLLASDRAIFGAENEALSIIILTITTQDDKLEYFSLMCRSQWIFFYSCRK